MKIFGKIVNKQIVVDLNTQYLQDIEAFEGLRVQITVQAINKRTTEQNRYYYGVVIPVILERLNELGYTLKELEPEEIDRKLQSNDVHNFLKNHFNLREENYHDGVYLGSYVESTANLSVKEFAQYIEFCTQWAVNNLDIIFDN